MKLISARFKNLRLLRDVFIDFSTDEDKNLTVIRAENGTGKTTAMNGLIWGLYGSKFVTEKLYPLSLVEDDLREINIEVEIDFETEEVVSRQGKTVVNEKVYRLIRKCTEFVAEDQKSFRRSNDNVSLYEKTDEGFKPILQSDIDNIIARALPAHLKDIYFTDGDKALTFIESTASGTEKRLRVQKAIEALLSMKELESLISNLKGVKLGFLRSIDKSDFGEKLIEAEVKIQSNEDWIKTGEEELKEFLVEKSNLEDSLGRLRKGIEDQLKLGNKEALATEVSSLKRQLKVSEELKENSVKALCTLLSSKSLSATLLQGKLSSANKLLGEMNARDNFPKQFIPVLNDILRRGECLCGSDLSGSTKEGLKKRNYITGVIEECREVDLLNSRASNLYFSPKDYQATDGKWKEHYDLHTKNYFNSDSSMRTTADSLKSKQVMIDDINDDLLIKLRDQEKIHNQKLREINNEIAISQDEVTRFKEQNIALKRDAEVFSSKLNKNNTAGGKHRLAEALTTIYENVFQEIKTSELKKVSEEMNRIFLSMIGADTGLNPKGMIRRAELSQEFDIKVYGPNDQPLNPDTELNGASRRAISLSFILALTKVSDVQAANIIDTPLGMTSGLVKASLVENLVRESSQVVLFLTFDEIKGVEKILDKYAGKAVTLSFSGHYPKMLRNEPKRQGVTEACNCNHREFCQICERTDQTNLVSRAS
ncbi:AAA family ATPase [Pseudidiomarina sp. 1APP75-32.1]|uniref:AAA family ATPase n=1 Tax=Pseudidiomarina terrestris TaxID=2820060 RepID=A0AAW7R2L2_9GAMM|nr:AAA family ATPase [Pseudidiomarina sp. 1APP75-32.1]MDN7124870.1 AAA family ATPase [Pseudidiomarina sp. 1APP75-32.1]